MLPRSSAMDNTIAARPRSPRVIVMLARLAFGGPAFAHELAELAGLERSNAVYPLLRWWIHRGVVAVEKLGGYNLYRVRREISEALEEALKIARRTRAATAAAVVERIAESRLLRRLKPVERELIALLLERLLDATSPYLRIRAETLQEALATLAAKLEARLRRSGLSPQAIASQLALLREALDELREESIIYVHWDTRSHTLILRVDRSLEEKLAELHLLQLR